MKDLYYVAQEISKQKNLKGNLLKYATGMASMYTGLAYMKLSMNIIPFMICVRKMRQSIRYLKNCLLRQTV